MAFIVYHDLASDQRCCRFQSNPGTNRDTALQTAEWCGRVSYRLQSEGGSIDHLKPLADLAIIISLSVTGVFHRREGGHKALRRLLYLAFQLVDQRVLSALCVVLYHSV